MKENRRMLILVIPFEESIFKMLPQEDQNDKLKFAGVDCMLFSSHQSG